MWLSINGTLTHTVATALHLRQAHEVEQCQLRGTHPGGAGLQTRALQSCFAVYPVGVCPVGWRRAVVAVYSCYLPLLFRDAV